jgi:hypothetical protein
MEGCARLKAQADRLGELSQELVRKAEAFETVDAQAQSDLSAVGRTLRSWQDSGLSFLSDAGLSWAEVRRSLGGAGEDETGPPPALAWLLGFLGFILKPFAQTGLGVGPPPLATSSGTPPPPGQTPTATPSPTMAVLPTAPPTPQGTPTAEEIWAQKRALAERRREEIEAEYRRRQELEDAWYAEDPMGYTLAKNEQVYIGARIDVNYLVSHRMNNPLPPGAFPYATDVMILNNANRVNKLFVNSLKLDSAQYSNYEPLYLERLKQTYTKEYEAAIAKAASDPLNPVDFVNVDVWE